MYLYVGENPCYVSHASHPYPFNLYKYLHISLLMLAELIFLRSVSNGSYDSPFHVVLKLSQKKKGFPARCIPIQDLGTFAWPRQVVGLNRRDETLV